LKFLEEHSKAIEWIVDKIKKILKSKNAIEDYYYEEYNKKIYVRKNGDGLIVNSFVLKVINPDAITDFVRSLDITDAKLTSKLIPFNDMLKTPIEHRFSEYGFWYSSDGNIISEVVEYYEQDSIYRRDDKRFTSVKFVIDKNAIKAGNTYNISYAYSIPGLFPISNGRFDVNNQNRNNYPEFTSHISVTHMGDHLRLSAYFEEGIDFKSIPEGYLIKHPNGRAQKPVMKRCEFKNNMFYKKYWIEIKNPQEYRDIYLQWNVKNPIQNEQGGVAEWKKKEEDDLLLLFA